MSLDQILLLGNAKLYEVSQEVTRDELNSLSPQIENLHKLVKEYKDVYGAGRAIAAPQIGLQKRIICYNDKKKVTMINPTLKFVSDEKIELWDDCMSFPHLMVKVKRYKYCTLKFFDMDWKEHTWDLKDDLSELLQHEYDHLDGILSTDRAIDRRAFKLV